MERSLPNFARETFSTLRNSFLFQDRGGYYAQMDQESENEEDDTDNYNNTMSHSLFYSIQQTDSDLNEDSIPLTVSNAYSDRSQLLFDQEQEESAAAATVQTKNMTDHQRPYEEQEYEESPKPSAIYLDGPPVTDPSVGLIHPQSLSESLLPTSASIPRKVTNSSRDKKFRDPVFAMLYTLCFSIFIVSGIVILFTTDSHAIEKYLKGTTFKTIKDSAGLLTVIISIALAVGALCLYVLRNFTKAFVWSSVVLVPVALSSVFIWSLVESFQNYYVVEGEKRFSTTDKGLTAMSFIPFILNLVYLKIIFDNKQRINRTITVIELACDVVRFNPGIFLVLLLLLAIFIIFSIVWITLFNRLWLIGHLSDKSSATGATWMVNNYVYTIAAFYVFIFMWTAKLLIYVERFAVSAITAQWYFHRSEPSTIADSQPPWKAALIRASTTSYGTVALGSLILATIQFLQFMARLLKKYSKTARPFATIASVILRFINALVSTFSNYTITVAGITGEGFYSAASSATKMFRRNLLTGLFGDLLTQVILYVGTSVIAITSGLGAYVYATHNLHSPHGFVVGLIGALMPWYLSQFFSYLMMSIIDAVFICYAIDLDTGTIHLSAAHSAFSSFE